MKIGLVIVAALIAALGLALLFFTAGQISTRVPARLAAALLALGEAPAQQA